jgi:hypothetical protein
MKGKFLFRKYYHDEEDGIPIKFGIDWHTYTSSKYKIYKEYTLRVYFFGRVLDFSFITNTREYNRNVRVSNIRKSLIYKWMLNNIK